jgi:hypothetical protein
VCCLIPAQRIQGSIAGVLYCTVGRRAGPSERREIAAWLGTGGVHTSTFRAGLLQHYPQNLQSRKETDNCKRMSKPIIQALTSLIPRHSGALPPELIELASSLLAQSRTKCSNLKQDEEIGRAYACANLACERYFTFYFSTPLTFKQLLISTSFQGSKQP